MFKHMKDVIVPSLLLFNIRQGLHLLLMELQDFRNLFLDPDIDVFNIILTGISLIDLKIKGPDQWS